MPRSVVVTGIGALTPLGKNVDSTWTALIEGRSGIGRISRWDPSEMPTQIAGEAPKNWDITAIMDARTARRLDLYTQYAFWAAKEALDDAALPSGSFDHERAGVIVGSGIGGIGTFDEQHRKFLEKGVRRISPFFISMMIPDTAAGLLSIEYDFRGINYATTSACATSGHAIGCAFDAIRYGRMDIMIAGGAEAPIVPISIAGFCQNRAMSTRNDEPEKASRPFDENRDGFVMSEGAGILVLEEAEHAIERGANIYCELAGFGATADAYHITAPPEDGDGAYRAMRDCLNDAGMQPSDVGYINAHGTSTPVGDTAECRAIERLFGKNAVYVSSIKGSLGHLLGAAAAVEAIAAIKTLLTGLIPPTLNLERPGDGCEGLRHVTKTTSAHVSAVISNSFGFGGHNSSLIFQK